jgi:hypothetical protein
MCCLGEQRTVRGCREELYGRSVTRKLPLDQRQVIIKGKKGTSSPRVLYWIHVGGIEKAMGVFYFGYKTICKKATAHL